MRPRAGSAAPVSYLRAGDLAAIPRQVVCVEPVLVAYEGIAEADATFHHRAACANCVRSGGAQHLATVRWRIVGIVIVVMALHPGAVVGAVAAQAVRPQHGVAWCLTALAVAIHVKPVGLAGELRTLGRAFARRANTVRDVWAGSFAAILWIAIIIKIVAVTLHLGACPCCLAVEAACSRNLATAQLTAVQDFPIAIGPISMTTKGFASPGAFAANAICLWQLRTTNFATIGRITVHIEEIWVARQSRALRRRAADVARCRGKFGASRFTSVSRIAIVVEEVVLTHVQHRASSRAAAVCALGLGHRRARCLAAVFNLAVRIKTVRVTLHRSALLRAAAGRAIPERDCWAANLAAVLDFLVDVEPIGVAKDVKAFQRLATAGDARRSRHAWTLHFAASILNPVGIVPVLVAAQGDRALERIVTFCAGGLGPRWARRFTAIGVVAVHFEAVGVALVVLANPRALAKHTISVRHLGAGRFAAISDVKVAIEETLSAIEGSANAILTTFADGVVHGGAQDLAAVAHVAILVVVIVFAFKLGAIGWSRALHTCGARQGWAASLATIRHVVIQVKGVGLAQELILAADHRAAWKNADVLAEGAFFAA
mmetsp:Transcript_67865/g.159741  ORF Transcript_67865/g.159741 Transcript_67865/m.159741 type:complete len:601 (-) Transcript_67865:926-2728(-)